MNMNESKDIDTNEITRVVYNWLGLQTSYYRWYDRWSTSRTRYTIEVYSTNEVKCLHIELTLDRNFILYIGQRSMLLTSMNEE